MDTKLQLNAAREIGKPWAFYFNVDHWPYWVWDTHVLSSLYLPIQCVRIEKSHYNNFVMFEKSVDLKFAKEEIEKLLKDFIKFDYAEVSNLRYDPKRLQFVDFELSKEFSDELEQKANIFHQAYVEELKKYGRIK